MFLTRRFLFTALAVAVTSTAGAQQAPPSDQLLPASTTLAYGALPSTPESTGRFEKTQLGRLLADPVMEPFLKDVHRQITSRLASSRKPLNLDWSDVRTSITGEAAGAILKSADGGTSELIMGNVTGQTALADKLLKDFDASLLANGSQRAVQEVHGTQLVVHTMPKTAKAKKARTVAYFLKNNLVLIATDVEAAATVLGLWNANGKGSLSADPGYQGVMARIKQESKGEQPDARWFFRPLALAEAARTEATNAGRGFETDIDYISVLKKQGFDGVQAVGGHHYFGHGIYDVSYRFAVHAPDPLKQGAGILSFPNAAMVDPQPWVPAGLATHTTLHLNVAKAFDAVGHLVDEMVDEKGFFIDLLESVKLDENGPMIDIKKDLVDKLALPGGTRVTALSDYVLKDGHVTPEGQRALIGVQAQDAVGLAKNIARSFKNDPAVKVRKFQGHVIYEIHENPNAQGGPKPAKEPPPTAVCVAHGQLLISTRMSLMEGVLGMEQAKPLAADPRFKLVDRELRRVAGGPVAFYAFAHTAEDVRPTYELFKMGKLREDQSVAGSLLRKILGEEGIKKNLIDGSKLPDFSVVRPYLGPTGWFVRTYDDGATGFGFTLSLEEE